jgi:hypothetical protein
MDAKRFDALSRVLSRGSSRRAALLGTLGSVLVALPVVRGDLTRAESRAPVTRTFVAKPMTGAKEVPGPGDAGAKGSAQFSITGSQICATFRFTTTTTPFQITGAHIHKGVAGVKGDIVVGFGAPVNGKTVCRTCPHATHCPDSRILSKIKANPAAYYANIHTADFPNGAVRGQLREVV